MGRRWFIYIYIYRYICFIYCRARKKLSTLLKCPKTDLFRKYWKEHGNRHILFCFCSTDVPLRPKPIFAVPLCWCLPLSFERRAQAKRSIRLNERACVCSLFFAESYLRAREYIGYLLVCDILIKMYAFKCWQFIQCDNLVLFRFLK